MNLGSGWKSRAAPPLSQPGHKFMAEGDDTSPSKGVCAGELLIFDCREIEAEREKCAPPFSIFKEVLS